MAELPFCYFSVFKYSCFQLVMKKYVSAKLLQGNLFLYHQNHKYLYFLADNRNSNTSEYVLKIIFIFYSKFEHKWYIENFQAKTKRK